MPAALSAAASLHPNVHLLEHSTVDVGPSVRVIGATMWSFVPPNVIPAVWAGLNDYEMIYHGGRRLSPDDTNRCGCELPMVPSSVLAIWSGFGGGCWETRYRFGYGVRVLVGALLTGPVVAQ